MSRSASISCGLQGLWICIFLHAVVLIGLPAPAGAAEIGPIPQWIWATRFPRRDESVIVQKTFTIPRAIQRAELVGLVDGRMSVTINSQFAGNVRGYREFERLDVSKLLRRGENQITILGNSESGAGALLARVNLTFSDGSTSTIVTDHTWSSRPADSGGRRSRRSAAGEENSTVSFGLLGVQPWGEPRGAEGDYYQWQEARGAKIAEDAARVQVTPGFQVELIRSSQPGEGSWVSLAFDPRGRLTIGREGPGLLRLTLPEHNGGTAKVETINTKLLECRGLLYAYDALYANANNSKGLYRLRDLDGDDQFETVELLHETGGGVGHGRNDLVLGPDGDIYLIHGNDVRLPADFETKDSPCRNYAVDRLIPCQWDRFLFDYQATLPAGHLVRTDRDGKKWELVACGMRNPYGLDFNEEGELFTFDADNEGDMGLPWYRPTRINHLVSGADYGWRQGTGNRPDWYPDSWPSNLNIGKSSPTAVKFGAKSRFPEPYRRALFILDWAYGRILAIHLTAHGASYRGTAENFLIGKPLNVTDLDFGPDGAMYFVTGGRGTQSGLYRVKYVGPAVQDKQEAAAGIQYTSRSIMEADPDESRRLRRRIEQYHRVVAPESIEAAWASLDSTDPWLRHAARIAVERQPVESWRNRALTETRTTSALTALMALARCDSAEVRDRLLKRLEAFPLDSLSDEQRLLALRTTQLCLVRMGMPDEKSAQGLAVRIAATYPSRIGPIDQLAGELLAFLKSPRLVEQTVPWLASSRFQEDSLVPLLLLRSVRTGWNAESRNAYFEALRRAGNAVGGRDVVTFLVSTRVEALAGVPDSERAALAARLTDSAQIAATAAPVETRPVVREWKSADFSGDELAARPTGAQVQRGREVFVEAKCVQCHRYDDRGHAAGPDLNFVSRRFGPRDLLDQVLLPSKVIDAKFRNVNLQLKSGRTVMGRVITGDDESLVLSANPLAPDDLTRVSLGDIETQTNSPVSPMPAGLVDGFRKEDILALLAYLAAH
jgi:putative heme-binding domain-containing protein